VASADILDRLHSAGEGWFYDDFSPSVLRDCGAGYRIEVTPGARPPVGVRVNLACRSVQCVGDAGSETRP